MNLYRAVKENSTQPTQPNMIVMVAHDLAQSIEFNAAMDSLRTTCEKKIPNLSENHFGSLVRRPWRPIPGLAADGHTALRD